MESYRTPPRPAKPAKKGKSPDDVADEGQGKVAHTLTACCRCRHRKTRCDAGLPRCEPCERAGSICEYFDSAKGKKIPRTYVIHLQNKVRQLEQELAQATEDSEVPLDAEVLMRGAGLVRVEENNEPRFLGPSSGIAMTRLVIQLAMQSSASKTIKEIVPEEKSKQIKDRFDKESAKPSSKVYPLISSVAAPDLPTRALTDQLVENYNRKAQYLLPVLHEPSFRQVVNDVYAGDKNAYKNFTLRMVIAISMQKLDRKWAGLADSYYLAALPFLEAAIQPMDLGTLQCFALITQYSLVTPTRTASSWVVGMATRLCQELGITDESTIKFSKEGTPLDPLEVDLRRRLFWIIIQFEFGVAHSLGRPCSWAVSHDHVNVQFFLPYDDDYITQSGVAPNAPLSMKKRIAMHFFKMRLLQSEIRHKLYLKKRPFPNNDQDPWFTQMEGKLNDWVRSAPKNDEGSGLTEQWFIVRNNTMIVFLYRPSPQVPEPSIRAAEKCFEASRYNIYKQLEQVRTRSVDLTWIFTQSLFMALNTLLWALSYPEIRKAHPKHVVQEHLNAAFETIMHASERWPGVESAFELYDTLIRECLKAYDGNSDTSYVIGSPSRPTPLGGSLSDVVTPPALSTPSTTQSSDHASPFSHVSGPEQVTFNRIQSQSEPPTSIHSEPLHSSPNPPPFTSHRSYEGPTQYQSDPTFNTGPYNNQLPAYDLGLATIPDPLQSSYQNQNFYLDSIGVQYPNYMYPQYSPPQETLESLDLESQSDLMSALESGGIDQMYLRPYTEPAGRGTLQYVTGRTLSKASS